MLEHFVAPSACHPSRTASPEKTQQEPFFVRFRSVFDRFSAPLTRGSSDESRVGPFSGLRAPLKNGENGENGRACSNLVRGRRRGLRLAEAFQLLAQLLEA